MFSHISFCSPRPRACVSRTPSSPRRGRGNGREHPIHASRKTMWPCQASVQLPKAHGSNAATKGNEVMGQGSMTNECTEFTVGVEGKLFVRVWVYVCKYFGSTSILTNAHWMGNGCFGVSWDVNLRALVDYKSVIVDRVLWQAGEEFWLDSLTL